MANLKEIRIRINSVRTTRQVTSAMKMVSAAKLNKAQSDIEHARPFVGKLQEIVDFLSNTVDGVEQTRGYKTKSKGKILLVPIASNKGLAGAFNANVVKEVERIIRTEYADEHARGEVEVMPISKQVEKALKSRGISSAKNFNDLFDNFNRQSIYDIADGFLEMIEGGDYREVHLVYNEFVNKSVQRLKKQQILPLQKSDAPVSERCLYLYVEPSEKEALETLVPQLVRTQLLTALLDSIASEHSARMTAMSKATDNATDLLSSLQLQYNKARQSAITNELIEIVSGAEALNG